MRTFVVGDIHGGQRSLLQCLERSGFDFREDRLITLGDMCDGWPDTARVLETLISLRHRVSILGNHDRWFLDWLEGKEAEEIWTSQGGWATIKSYGNLRSSVPDSHVKFLKSCPYYYESEGVEGSRLFVHGGIDPNQKDIKKQDSYTLIWDRGLIESAVKKARAKPGFKFGGYGEIYVGHTSTTLFKLSAPSKLCNVWAMDTGGGWEGRLSIMDVDTKGFWQSDPVHQLYPETDHAKEFRRRRYGIV